MRADDVTVAEVTLQRCQWHPIHVTGGANSDTTGTVIYRVRVIDPGQQAIKITRATGTLNGLEVSLIGVETATVLFQDHLDPISDSTGDLSRFGTARRGFGSTTEFLATHPKALFAPSTPDDDHDVRPRTTVGHAARGAHGSDPLTVDAQQHVVLL